MDRAICGYLVEASRKLDHEDFKLQSLAESYGLSTVSEWTELIESKVIDMNRVRPNLFGNPETYLKSTSNAICWADAEVLFNQSMDRTRYDSKSVPVNVGKGLIHSLSLQSNRYTVLIADLLPELVESKLFDQQMQAVLRGKWIIIDSIIDNWYSDRRTLESSVPRWLVEVDFGCLRNGN